MLPKLAWLLLTAIHVLPALAALRPSLLTTLYGMEPGTTAFLLVQHRALLFVAVLAACLWAVFDANVRRLAVVMTAISMIGFLLLYWLGGAPEALRLIVIVDLIGLPVLAYAAWTAFGAAGRMG